MTTATLPRITPDLWRRKPPSLCQLAGVYHPGPGFAGWLIEQKIDGWRMLSIDGQLFTRNGTPFRGVAHIERALRVLQAQFDQPMFFDGEFVVGTGLHTLAQTKAHQDSGWKVGGAGTFHIFDAIPMAEWQYADGDTPLSRRKEALGGAFVGMMEAVEAWELGWTDGTPCPLQYVPHRVARSRETIDLAADAIWAAQGEGVVVKAPGAPYRRNRNDTWLKLRRDIEGRC